MTLRENRLRSSEDREPRCEIQLVFKIRWKVYRTAYASRTRCGRVSKNILVILGGLVFVLWARTNCKNISMAKEFVTANEIHVPAKIVRIELLDPFPKVRRKESAFPNIVLEPEQTDIELSVSSPNA